MYIDDAIRDNDDVNIYIDDAIIEITMIWLYIYIYILMMQL